MFGPLLTMAVLATGAAATSSISSSTTTSATPTENHVQITFFNPHQTAQVPLFPNWANYTSSSALGSLYSSASMINADACESTIAVIYTPPGIHPVTATITDGVSRYEKTYSFSTDGFEATASQSCKKGSSDQATCTETWSASNTRMSTSETSTATYSGLQYGVIVYEVSQKWAGATTGTCTKGGNAAAPTGLAGDVYKVIVVPAAAMLAAAVV